MFPLTLDLAGASSTNPTLDALNFDNIVFYANVDDAHFLSEKELDGDEDK